MSQYIQDFRAKYPQYNDVPDDKLVTSLHQKYYSDMPIQDFNTKIGYSSVQNDGSLIKPNPVMPSSSVFEKTLRHEGGIVDDPDDPGGYTAFGLSSARFGDVVKSVKTKEDAIPFYQKEWENGGYNNIRDKYTAEHMFDVNWLSGGGHKNVIVPAAESVGLDPNNLTESLNNADTSTLQKFNNEIANKRISYFNKVVENNPKTSKFVPGWQKRANSWRNYQQLAPDEVPIKAPEEKSMLELIGDKMANLGLGFAERSNQLVGNLVGFGNTVGGAITDKLDKTMQDYGPDLYRSDEYKKILKDIREKQRSTDKKLADDLKNIDLGYKEQVGTEDIKKAYKEGGLVNPALYAKVLEFGLEQGIKSIPDMTGASLALPPYIMARSQEMGDTRAKNKGKDSADMQDVLEAAPFAIASSLFESIGAKGISSALERKVGEEILTAGIKNTAKKILSSGAKGLVEEGATEAIQEGMIEYVGEKFGTDAKMSWKEALERGAFAGLAGGVMGGVGGVALSSIESSAPKSKNEVVSNEQVNPIVNTKDIIEPINQPVEEASAEPVKTKETTQEAETKAEIEPIVVGRDKPKQLDSTTINDYSKLTESEIDNLNYSNGIKDVAKSIGVDIDKNQFVGDIRENIKKKLNIIKKVKISENEYSSYKKDDSRAQYHGTSQSIEDIQDGHYSTMNIYGQGFYTTDSKDISIGYTKKGKGNDPVVYKVNFKRKPKLYDMEKGFDKEITNIIDDVSKYNEIIKIAISDNPKNLRELYDIARQESSGQNISADEVQEAFDSIAYNLSSIGYDGLRHVGGRNTNKPPHNVEIIFNPKDIIDIEKIKDIKSLSMESPKNKMIDNLEKSKKEIDSYKGELKENEIFVYHGEDKNSTPKVDNLRYYTTSKDYASRYGDIIYKAKIDLDKSNIVEIEFDLSNNYSLEEFKNEINNFYPEIKRAVEESINTNDINDEFEFYPWMVFETNTFKKELKKLGFDGIKFEEFGNESYALVNDIHSIKPNSQKTVEKEPKTTKSAKNNVETLISEKDSIVKKEPKELYAQGSDSPMGNYQMPYSAKGMPERPSNDAIMIGDKEVKLKPIDNPTRREGIQAQVEGIIGPRLYNSKIKNKSALGIYDSQNSAIRIKDYHEVEVLAHEMAHFLDIHHAMKNKFTDAYKNNAESLKEVSSLSYTNNKEVVETEGFAEYVRLWLTQYNKAKELAPTFTNRFETVLSRDKNLERKMKLLQADMHRWVNQGDLSSFYAITSGNQYTPKERITRVLNRRPASLLRQKYVDHIHAAKVITSDVKGHLGDATTDPYKQLQLLNGTEGIFEQSMKYGAPFLNKDGNISFVGPSYEDIWGESLKHSVKRLREQELYFISRRAIETTRQERENLITRAQIREGIALGKKHPYFKESFKKYQELRKNLFDFYVDSGYIERSVANKILEKNKNYVPFHREVEGVIESGKGSGASFQRLKGGTQNIKPVYDNMLMQDSKHLQAALKAKAIRDLYVQGLSSQEGSKYFTKISEDAKPVSVMLEQMKQKTIKMMEELGIDGGIDPDQDINDYFEAFPEELMFWNFGNKPKTLETMVDSFIDEKTGERVWVEFNKENELLPDMIDALSGFSLPKGVAGTALSVAMRVKQLQTLTITSMMQFAGPNIVRDQQQAFFLSAGKYRPIIDTIKGFNEYVKSHFTENSLFDEMRAQGGPGGGRVKTFLENEWGFSDRKQYKLKKPFYHPVQIAKDLLDIYTSIMDSAEMSTRIGFYSRLVSTGTSPREAAFQAREISTDFAKHGSYAPFVLLQRTVPFFGAYVQAVDRDLRGMFERNGEIKFSNLLKNPNGEKEYSNIKMKMVGIGMLYTAIHISLALLGNDEEKYKELTPDQKSRFFHYFINGKHYTIPKPHGLIALFGSLAEGITDLVKGQDLEFVKKDILFALAYHLGADAMPGILNPVAELALNETFTGAPIVDNWSQNRSAEYQYSERTPQLYVNIGKGLRASPDKVRHIVKGYLGYIEEVIAENTEEYLWDYEAWGDRPDKKTYGDMVSKQFVPKDVPYRTKYTVGYYDLKKRAITAKANFDFGIQQAYRDKEIVKKTISQDVDKNLLALDKAFAEVDKILKAIKLNASVISYNKELSAEEKTKKIDNLYLQKNSMLKMIYEQITNNIKKVEDKVNSLDNKEVK